MGRRRREGGQGGRGATAPASAGADEPRPARPHPPSDPLSAEDRALWARVAATVQPLDPQRDPRRSAPADDAPRPPAEGADGGDDAPFRPPPTGPRPGRAGPPASPPVASALATDAVWPPVDFRVGAAARPGAPATVRLAPEPGQVLREHPLRMDHKTHRRMTQGRIAPEARIDLHGMTLAIAQPVLTRFVLDARARGARLVLVITGKGRPGGPEAPLPVRPGALRHHVPHWLHMPPLGAIVLQVRPAHPRHGGEGAYYVWLRRADR